MDLLQSCMDGLRLLARQPDTPDRLRLAEIRVNEYLGPDAAALPSLLERLAEAIRVEGQDVRRRRRPSSTAPWLCCLAQLLAPGRYDDFSSVASWAFVGVDACGRTKADRFQYHFVAADRTSCRQRRLPERQSV